MVVLLKILSYDFTYAHLESAEQYVGSIIEIYFDSFDGCYLHMKDDPTSTKNAEFRCGKTEGDLFWIKKSGDVENDFLIGKDDCGLSWNRNSGSTKNAEFQCGSPGDKIWIRRQTDGRWAFGYDDCPLVWLGGDGNIKSAEFRCGYDDGPDPFKIRSSMSYPSHEGGLYRIELRWD